MDKAFLYMLGMVPVAIVAHFLNVPPVAMFFLAAIAIVPLAKFIGEATEVLAVYTGPALGGLLNATFGNATELIISILAIRVGLIEVVKASITGSIISNLLLVLGSAMFAGGILHKKQTFNKTAAMSSSATLLLAVAALIIPAMFLITSPTAGENIIEELSIFVSIIMLVVYFASIWFMLHTHKHLYTEEVGELEEKEAKWSKAKCITILLLTTVVVAWVSEILVGSIEPIVASYGWTELFIGVIFVAIIGNAAEHTSSITMARKNRMDLALQISIGSATQIAMFVAPALVLISLLFKEHMTLVFNTFELVAIVLSVIIANLVVEDGESNWLEGLQLFMAYVIMAVAFFFHP